MRGYGRVPMLLWDGKGADALGRIRDKNARHLARHVLLYFLTAPDSFSVGLYEISLRTIARHTELDEREVAIALEALHQARLAYYDEEREVVYVPVMAHVEHPDDMKVRDKQYTGITKHLKKPNLRRSLYFGPFMKEHAERLHLPSAVGGGGGGGSSCQPR